MLAPWEKSYDQPRQHTKKQRHYFANKGPSSQSYGFSNRCVWMWELEKKAERWRIDAFELWCWRRLLRVPWTARRSNQSTLKKISPGCLLEGLMLKLQYSGHLMRRTDSLEKTLMLGKTEGGRRRGQQRMRWLDGIIHLIDISLSSGSWWWTGKPGVLRSTGSQSWTRLSDWTEMNTWSSSPPPLGCPTSVHGNCIPPAAQTGWVNPLPSLILHIQSACKSCWLYLEIYPESNHCLLRPQWLSWYQTTAVSKWAYCSSSWWFPFFLCPLHQPRH